ncbi:MAG: isoprenylcysteine carboxylmethyltransferase family protein [Thiolinea sp.]
MLKTVIPPPVYALAAAGVMWGLDRYWPVLEWLAPPWNRVGWLLMGGGFLLDLGSLGMFLRARTTPNPMRPGRASQLVVSGMYRYTRNPMYLGMLLVLTGWALHLGSLTPWLVLPLFVWVLTVQQIIPEEQVLAEKFGQSYREYQQRVRRWL